MKTVLIVDDQPHVARVLTLCLSGAGFEVDCAPNGRVALERVRLCAPDVLITDIQMPEMDGRALCEAIHAEFPQRAFPIFVMTSMTERENREWAGRIPGTTFLEKPVSPRTLVRQLQQLVAGTGFESAA